MRRNTETYSIFSNDNLINFRLGSDPEKLFSFNLMQKHLHRFGKFGFILATVILPLLGTEKGNGLNIDEMANNAGNHNDSQIFDTFYKNSMNKFNARLRDVAIDMIQLGYV